MRRFVKGAIVFLLCGVVTVTSVNAANDVQTFLFTDNPLLENPSGYAGTWGYKDVYASITVTKKGYKKRFSDDGDYSKNKKRLTCETDRVWGQHLRLQELSLVVNTQHIQKKVHIRVIQKHISTNLMRGLL